MRYCLLEYLALGWTVYFHSGFTTEWELLLEIGQTIYHAKISHVMQWKLSLHIFLFVNFSVLQVFCCSVKSNSHY